MLRILLVEDQKEAREIMAIVLQSLGYEVLTAATAAEALAVAGREKVDLLVCDIVLPDGSGCDVMMRLRNNPAIRGIAVSGYGRPEDRRRSLEAGFRRHLVKPVGVDTFESVLREVAAG